jgi:hypothetical protein
MMAILKVLIRSFPGGAEEKKKRIGEEGPISGLGLIPGSFECDV